MTDTKHTPGAWRVASPLGIPEVVTDGPAIYSKSICSGFGKEIIDNATAAANARIIAAAPDLLAYAECSAAMDCGQADPAYDPQPILKNHGWNVQENPSLFLARIRRDALNKAVGHYLGRAAT